MSILSRLIDVNMSYKLSFIALIFNSLACPFNFRNNRISLPIPVLVMIGTLLKSSSTYFCEAERSSLKAFFKGSPSFSVIGPEILAVMTVSAGIIVMSISFSFCFFYLSACATSNKSKGQNSKKLSELCIVLSQSAWKQKMLNEMWNKNYLISESFAIT